MNNTVEGARGIRTAVLVHFRISILSNTITSTYSAGPTIELENTYDVIITNNIIQPAGMAFLIYRGVVCLFDHNTVVGNLTMSMIAALSNTSNNIQLTNNIFYSTNVAATDVYFAGDASFLSGIHFDYNLITYHRKSAYNLSFSDWQAHGQDVHSRLVPVPESLSQVFATSPPSSLYLSGCDSLAYDMGSVTSVAYDKDDHLRTADHHDVGCYIGPIPNATCPTMPHGLVGSPVWASNCTDLAHRGVCFGACQGNYTGAVRVQCEGGYPQYLACQAYCPSPPPAAASGVWNLNCTGLFAAKTCFGVCASDSAGTLEASCSGPGTWAVVTEDCHKRCWSAPPALGNWTTAWLGTYHNTTIQGDCFTNTTVIVKAKCLDGVWELVSGGDVCLSNDSPATSNTATIVVAVVVPLAVLGLGAVAFCIYKKKKTAGLKNQDAKQMKTTAAATTATTTTTTTTAESEKTPMNKKDGKEKEKETEKKEKKSAV